MIGDMLPAGIIGFGRVGAAFAGALAEAGHPLVAVAARSPASRDKADAVAPAAGIVSPRQVAQRAGLVFLTVPDARIGPVAAELAQAWRPGQIVAHASGALGVEVLQPVLAAGGVGLAIHPAMTFTGTSLDIARMRGAAFAVDAPPGMLPLAQALAVELGGRPVAVAGADRPVYHAALSHAANHLVTILAQAADLLAASGVADPSAVLGPLARAALENALDLGAAALTGPASRGDCLTLAAHTQALAAFAARRGGLVDGSVAVDAAGRAALDTAATYRQLAQATLRAAAAAGRITAQQLAACQAALTAGAES
ncbi:MAG: DUF2520 domain-containing protein [Bifidobacteriaceae bacterium]|jgi:predicted short-subunit dehydrogenase-like oxidoreductase (DUF2520 family)|nr:DUF2520 domain-containing protein [Bifidobacteriaceae bacterium]